MAEAEDQPETEAMGIPTCPSDKENQERNLGPATPGSTLKATMMRPTLYPTLPIALPETE